ncbi:MAG: polysaccharide biosynthesis C-terminal domain-containing protein, partial [Pseudomonadota bacterium]
SGSAEAVTAGALFLFLNSFLLLRLGVHRGLEKPLLPQFLEAVLRPLLVLGLFFLAIEFKGKTSASGALWSFVAVALLLQLPLLLTGSAVRHAGNDAPAAAGGVPREWLRAGVAMSLGSGALIMMYSADVIMLNWFRGAEEAGVYSVISRLSILVIFGMNCAQIVVGPALSRAFASGDTARLRHLASLAAVMSAGVGLAVGGVLTIFGQYAVGMFGPDYLTGLTALTILVVGQLLNTATGITGTFMNMVGEPTRLLRFVILGLVLNLALNLVLIPRYGAQGAAVSAVAGHLFWNVLALIHIRRAFDVDVSLIAGLRDTSRWLARRAG